MLFFPSAFPELLALGWQGSGIHLVLMLAALAAAIVPGWVALRSRPRCAPAAPTVRFVQSARDLDSPRAAA